MSAVPEARRLAARGWRFGAHTVRRIRPRLSCPQAGARGARGYPRAVAVFGRSSIPARLTSVLSLCAPHWGQRSADDQAPHRGHALCVPFGTASLTLHRCRIFHFLKPRNKAIPSKSMSACHRIWRLPGRRNIMDQFHPNWKPERKLPSPGSLVPVATALWPSRFVAAAGRSTRPRFA